MDDGGYGKAVSLLPSGSCTCSGHGIAFLGQRSPEVLKFFENVTPYALRGVICASS